VLALIEVLSMKLAVYLPATSGATLIACLTTQGLHWMTSHYSLHKKIIQ
jgi:hypothetical protein